MCLTKRRIFFWLFLLFPWLLSGQSSYSLKEQIQSELLTLKVQLLSCEKVISGLKKEVDDLEKQLKTSEDLTKTLRAQWLEYKVELGRQQELYNQLWSQYKSLKDSLQRLETENTWLKIGLIGTGIVATGLLIYAIAK